MARMSEEGFFRRLFAKDEHAEKLADHRQALEDALAKFQVAPRPRRRCTGFLANGYLQSFQVMQLARISPSITRIEKKQDSVLHAAGTSRSRWWQGSITRRGITAGWLSGAMTSGILGASKIFFPIHQSPHSRWSLLDLPRPPRCAHQKLDRQFTLGGQ